jgi:hypothetical protein
MDSDTSHRYIVIWNRTLYVGILYAAGVNIGSLVHYIDAGGMAHCPLIE